MDKELLKKDTKVLWLRDEAKAIVDFAHITGVKGKTIKLEWYEGHELKKETVDEDQILAIEDKDAGLDIEIGGYSGKGILTKSGYEYAGVHEKEETTTIKKKSKK